MVTRHHLQTSNFNSLMRHLDCIMHANVSYFLCCTQQDPIVQRLNSAIYYSQTSCKQRPKMQRLSGSLLEVVVYKN